MSRNQEYKHRIRVGYQESNNGLRITIPDKIRFPANMVHVHFRDQHTVVLAQDRTEATTYTMSLCRNQAQVPECRFFTILGIKGIGDHFGIIPAQYKAEGPNLIVSIPAESCRRQLKRRRTKLEMAAKPAIVDESSSFKTNGAAEPQAEVLIDMHGTDYVFKVPFNEVMQVVLEWSRKGYEC